MQPPSLRLKKLFFPFLLLSVLTLHFREIVQFHCREPKSYHTAEKLSAPCFSLQKIRLDLLMVSSCHGKYFTTTLPLPFSMINFWFHLTRPEWQLLQSLLQYNLIATRVIGKCISSCPTHLNISIETILGPHLLWAPAMIIFSLTHRQVFLQMSPGI